MAHWVRAVAQSDCPAGTLKGVMVEGMPVVLANVDGDIYALEDKCSHQDLPISDGELEGDEIMCIYHGARFECATGKNKALPAVRPVKSYAVEIREGDVFVDVG